MFEHRDVRVRAGPKLPSTAGHRKHMDVFSAAFRGGLSLGDFSLAIKEKSLEPAEGRIEIESHQNTKTTDRPKGGSKRRLRETARRADRTLGCAKPPAHRLETPVPRASPGIYNSRPFRPDPIAMTIPTIKSDAEQRMQKSIDALRNELMHLRTGRASTALVDRLKVPYYGSDVPLTQVATVAVADARSLIITPWEKNMVGPIEKAILASDLGLTPTTAGLVIRINLPQLTEERRKELGKHVHHEGENAKVAVRNIRRDALQHVKELLKDKKITEDEEHRAEDDVQKLTDRFVKSVDELVKSKEQEILQL